MIEFVSITFNHYQTSSNLLCFLLKCFKAFWMSMAKNKLILLNCIPYSRHLIGATSRWTTYLLMHTYLRGKCTFYIKFLKGRMQNFSYFLQPQFSQRYYSHPVKMPSLLHQTKMTATKALCSIEAILKHGQHSIDGHVDVESCD